MRRSPVLLLLAGSLTLLASLYLPWETATSSGDGGEGLLVLLHEFGFPAGYTGWWPAAALAGLALALAAATSLVLPREPPLGRLAVGTVSLALGSAAVLRAETRAEGPPVHLSFHPAYGVWIAGVGGVAVLAGAAALRRDELARPAPSVLPAALLFVALLLPWRHGAGGSTIVGIAAPPAVVAAALAAWLVGDPLPELAGAVALFTGATVAWSSGGGLAYGAWLGIAAAAGLVLLAPRHPARRRLDLVAGAAAALLVAALFLPWQTECQTGGPCVSTDGWTAAGTVAALVALVAPALVREAAPELALGLAVTVTTLGTSISRLRTGQERLSAGYGATLGYVAAALLVLALAVRIAPRRVDPRRALLRLVPLAAAVTLVTVLVLPWWGLLRPLRIAGASWLMLAVALGAIRLVCAWARRLVAAGGSPAGELALLPLGLLAGLGLELIARREEGIGSGGCVAVVLCLALAWLGRTEERDGLERLRVPEILRLDRI